MTKAPFSTMISPTGKHQCTRIPIARNPRDKTGSFRLRIDLRQSRCERFGPGHISRRQRSCRFHHAHNLTTHYPVFIDPLVYTTKLTEWALPQTTYLSDSLTSVRMQGHRPPDVRATQASLALMIIPYIPCISYICRPFWYN